MPVVRIEVPEGTPRTVKHRVREGVKSAVLEALAPREARYDYVGVREVLGEIGDGLPLVTVDLRPGREPARKQALVRALAEVLHAELGVDAGDVYVLFRETAAENHYCGGSPLPPWVAADR